MATYYIKDLLEVDYYGYWIDRISLFLYPVSEHETRKFGKYEIRSIRSNKCYLFYDLISMKYVNYLTTICLRPLRKSKKKGVTKYQFLSR